MQAAALLRKRYRLSFSLLDLLGSRHRSEDKASTIRSRESPSDDSDEHIIVRASDCDELEGVHLSFDEASLLAFTS
eukprot:754234-Hanusia_phi.AAC.4